VSSVVQDCLGSLPQAQQEALEKGVLYYFTGKPCKHGHVAKRYVTNKTCVMCQGTNSLQWRGSNRDKEQKRISQWRKTNPDKRCATEAKRRANKKNATPFWANQEKIKRFYAKSKKFEQLTGIIHHVDHIYPLKSDFLCGLHVENNLQVLTAEKNISKNNRTWPGQLPCQVGSGKDHAWWCELNERIQSPSVSAGLSL